MREQRVPSALAASAPVVWSMLASAGWNHYADADRVEDEIAERYSYLVEHPDSDYISSGRITLEREWDGDDFVGIRLRVEVVTVYDHDLSDFPRPS